MNLVLGGIGRTQPSYKAGPSREELVQRRDFAASIRPQSPSSEQLLQAQGAFVALRHLHLTPEQKRLVAQLSKLFKQGVTADGIKGVEVDSEVLGSLPERQRVLFSIMLRELEFTTLNGKMRHSSVNVPKEINGRLGERPAS